MRLGVDIRLLQGPNANRGIGRYTKNLIRGLREHAPEIEQIFFVRDGKPVPDNLPPGKVITVETPPLSGYERYFRFASLRHLYQRRMLERHRSAFTRAAEKAQLDVLQFPNILEQDYFATVRPVCPTVTTLYDLIPLIMPDIYINTWMISHQETYRMQIEMYNEADIIGSISQSALDDIARLIGISRSKMVVMPGSLPTERLEEWGDVEQQKSALARYHLQKPYFLYCSGSGANKNVERTIDAYALYAQRTSRPIPFVLAGKWPDENRKALETQAAQRRLSPEQLRFLGFVPDDDLWRLLAGATALITVSLYEGFGLPAAEAMAVGTPVLTSTASSLPEVVGDAGLKVPPEDVEAIADGFHRLATDDALRAQMSECGRARFLQRFTLEQQAKDYRNLYRRLIDGKAGRG